MSHRNAPSRRDFIKSASAMAATMALGGCRPASRTIGAPNVIFLLADDLGWGDLGCYGSETVLTPRLDAMAAAGTRWDRFYAASAVCSPTRCSCLTGRYPIRFGYTKHRGEAQKVQLADHTVTLPRLLRDAGYDTAHVGKWHLGGDNLRQLGFDHVLRAHYPMKELGGDQSRMFLDGARYLRRNDEPVEPSDRFLTEAFVDEAIEVIRKSAGAGRPFFLNLWFYVPHTPYNLAPEPYVAPYRGRAEGDDLAYRSMITCMDAGIGRILDELERLGLAGNTLTAFTSDNGPSYRGSPGPWSGGKADLHEGGIRMPLITHWPGRGVAGQITDALGHTNDLLPTFCSAAAVPLPGDVEFDGIDLLPVIEGGSLPERPPLFWQMDLYEWYPQPGSKPAPYATEVALHGRWKLLARQAVPQALYDVVADPGETTDLRERHPEVVRRLSTELRIWLEEASRLPPR